jgi:hypothetical protein
MHKFSFYYTNSKLKIVQTIFNLEWLVPASPADIDVLEIRKLQQYMRGYNSSLVQSGLRRIGLLLMYNQYYSN